MIELTDGKRERFCNREVVKGMVSNEFALVIKSHDFQNVRGMIAALADTSSLV